MDKQTLVQKINSLKIQNLSTKDIFDLIKTEAISIWSEKEILELIVSTPSFEIQNRYKTYNLILSYSLFIPMLFQVVFILNRYGLNLRILLILSIVVFIINIIPMFIFFRLKNFKREGYKTGLIYFLLGSLGGIKVLTSALINNSKQTDTTYISMILFFTIYFISMTYLLYKCIILFWPEINWKNEFNIKPGQLFNKF